MLFITLEDDTGFINLVCNPKTIDIFREILWQHSFLCVRGELQRDQDSLSILVEQAYPPVSDVRAIHQPAQASLPKTEPWELALRCGISADPQAPWVIGVEIGRAGMAIGHRADGKGGN